MTIKVPLYEWGTQVNNCNEAAQVDGRLKGLYACEAVCCSVLSMSCPRIFTQTKAVKRANHPDPFRKQKYCNSLLFFSMRGRRIYQKYNKDVLSLQVTHWNNNNKDLIQVQVCFATAYFPISDRPAMAQHGTSGKKKADMTMSFKFNQLCNWIMIILKWYCQVPPDDSTALLSALRSSFWFSELLEFVCCDLMEGLSAAHVWTMWIVFFLCSQCLVL